MIDETGKTSISLPLMRPVICVVGPTASGKTDVAQLLAQNLSGEVVSADSMQIYRGLDVGTAKPTAEDRQGIPHHLMDFLPPEAPYSVADFTAMNGKCVQPKSSASMPACLSGVAYSAIASCSSALSNCSPSISGTKRGQASG